MDEERVEELWNEIWALLEEGRSEEAASASLKALNMSEGRPEFHYLLGLSLLDLDEVEAALPELEQAASVASGWADPHSALAWAHFRSCAFAEAREALEAALQLDPELAESHQLRGLLAERAGDEPGAAAAFAEARRLDPDRYPEPVRMDEEEFLGIAREAVKDLDEPIREVLDETAFFVQLVPSEELLEEADPPLDPQILGLFLGRSLLEQSVQDSGTLPNTLYLFQRNLERTALSREDLEEEIRITVLHEIGHHIGWDEAELEARGLA